LPKSFEKTKSTRHSENFGNSAGEASGIYTWVIATDTVYADSLVADIFGFGHDDARRGLALKDYLARMHPDDLPRVAKAIHDTMTSGVPFSEQYRVCRPDGSMMEITAFGSCFCDSNNEPSHYSGIIFPAGFVDCSENAIVTHLLAAYDLAFREGKTVLAEKIIEALVESGWQAGNEDVDLPVGQIH
jgi:PAS domain-containing protein